MEFLYTQKTRSGCQISLGEKREGEADFERRLVVREPEFVQEERRCWLERESGKPEGREASGISPIRRETRKDRSPQPVSKDPHDVFNELAKRAIAVAAAFFGECRIRPKDIGVDEVHAAPGLGDGFEVFELVALSAKLREECRGGGRREEGESIDRGREEAVHFVKVGFA